MLSAPFTTRGKGPVRGPSNFRRAPRSVSGVCPTPPLRDSRAGGLVSELCPICKRGARRSHRVFGGARRARDPRRPRGPPGPPHYDRHKFQLVIRDELYIGE